jgi:hypothetical protein
MFLVCHGFCSDCYIKDAALETAPRAARITVRKPNGSQRLLVADRCCIELEDLFGDDHLQFVDLGQVGKSTGILFTVEDLFAVQVHLQPAMTSGGEFYGYITGSVVAKELIRQPRGDREVPSRYAVRDFNVYFAVL